MSVEGAQPLREVLRARKSAIVDAWLLRTLQSYPEHTSRFLLEEKDHFRNPVGHTLREALPVLFDQLLGAMDATAVTSALDGIVRIRAVQDFTAGQAMAFLFLLKPVVREARARAGGEDTQRVPGEGANRADGLAALEERIDQMALLAFDLFMHCRERIYEIKANEARRRVGILLKRYGIEGGNGETENRGNGDVSHRITDSPVPRFTDSPIQDRSKP